MRGAFLLLVLFSLCDFGELSAQSAQQKHGWPRPEVMVAPTYPRRALARHIEATIEVDVFVDLHGRVTRATAVEGPCRYASPPANPEAVPCDFARAAEDHQALADKYLAQSLNQGLSEAERRANQKAFDTEAWLAAQFEVYAAAEQAARQWSFESVAPATRPGHHVIPLTFRFSRGDLASIQVVDPWTISVTGALYPSIQE